MRILVIDKQISYLMKILFPFNSRASSANLLRAIFLPVEFDSAEDV